MQKLRFNKYKEGYRKLKLQDLLINHSVKNKNLQVLLVESISNKHGFIKQEEQFEDRVIASKDLTNYTVIDDCTFAYNPSRLNVGSIAYKERGKERSVVSPLYVCFKTNEKLEDSYLWYWFQTSQFNRQRELFTEGGVRDSLSFTNLKELQILLPINKEQIKIGSSIEILF
ncbi:restriction endonuclease subunit S [Psittacicella gerlachiana]|uniref:Type I restriction modification DNA specificity domain-containing protein n=1 Tax=Psittacicella gerlachiana TaxID=2028574 RepID=A0A3A1Y5I6_9GAMM|nr:restriction endonuclease subunit S [Psittacicella gerlachiana]RIY32468.1 hypothetical protein CKF59_06940 [Psittacicella gerlachiana]